MQTDVARRTMTAESFEQYIALPENADRRLELIEGEVFEAVSDDRSSEVAMLIGTMITLFVRTHGLGRVTSADGGYEVAGNRFIPDVAFISSTRQPNRPHTAWNPLAPDLAVEVLSPGNSDEEIRMKVGSYLYAGTTVWIVDPERRRVEVYPPGKPPFSAGTQDTLSGGDVLPGFTLSIAEIFPE